MKTRLMRALVTPILLLVISACSQDAIRPCDPSLEQLFPQSDIFGKGAIMSMPDRGVSVESLAQPNSVCKADYTTPEGIGAILNIYVFDDIDGAATGFQRLSERAETINPDFDTPQQSPSTSSLGPRADNLSIACHARDSRSTCRTVARYGLRVYWLGISQDPSSSFMQDHFTQIINAMESEMIYNSE